ncbi:hypothetical protein OQA88_6088 [Cercophora sp. LCS_1]
MSGPAFVVMPVEAGDTQHRRQETEKITSALRQGLCEQQHPREEEMRQERIKQEEMKMEAENQHGPLTELFGMRDLPLSSTVPRNEGADTFNSSRQLVQWEDPLRTIGSYIAAMSILLGMHYLPLTQLGLKAGTVILGLISISEFANRSFGPNTILSRLRPKEYRKVSEPILNGTLKDVHDFVQYSTVQIQRILYAEDLYKTFLAFLLLTTMYSLAKIASPFSWAILGLTSVYVCPLLLSPQGRAVGKEAMGLAGDMATATIENGKLMANAASARAGQSAARAQGMAQDASQRAGNIVENGKAYVHDTSVRVAEQTSNVTHDVGRRVGDLSTRAKNTVWGGKGTNRSVEEADASAAATGFDEGASKKSGSTTGSLRLDGDHQQHLNTDSVDQETHHNKPSSKASEPSNVVPAKV